MPFQKRFSSNIHLMTFIQWTPFFATLDIFRSWAVNDALSVSLWIHPTLLVFRLPEAAHTGQHAMYAMEVSFFWVSPSPCRPLILNHYLNGPMNPCINVAARLPRCLEDERRVQKLVASQAHQVPL